MGKLSFGRVLDCFSLSSCSSSCFCMNSSSMENQDEFERNPLIASDRGQLLRLKDVVAGNQTLAFQLKPKMVTLRVSMHCNGCARKVRETHLKDGRSDLVQSRLGKQDGGCYRRHSSFRSAGECVQG